MKPNQIPKAATDGKQKKEHSYQKTNVKLGAAVEKTGDADAMGKKFRPHGRNATKDSVLQKLPNIVAV